MRPLTRVLVALLVASALPVGAGSLVAGASSVAACSSSAVVLSVASSRTSYPSGSTVLVTVDLRNHGASACSFVTGPTSPNYQVTNAAGTTVWGSCWFAGGPAPCPMYLLERVLRPGVTYRDVLTWDQRSGHPDVRVRPGRYRFSVTFSGLSLKAATSFTLLAS